MRDGKENSGTLGYHALQARANDQCQCTKK